DDVFHYVDVHLLDALEHHVDDLEARRGQTSRGLLEPGDYVRLAHRGEPAPRHPDPILGQRFGWRRNIVSRVRVELILTGDRSQEEQAIHGVAGQETYVVQSPGKGRHTVSTHPSIGWLDADRTAPGGGDAHGTPGVSADGEWQQPSPNGCGRARSGSARHPGRVVGVDGEIVGPGRELVGTHLRHGDRPGADDAADDRGRHVG